MSDMSMGIALQTFKSSIYMKICIGQYVQNENHIDAIWILTNREPRLQLRVIFSFLLFRHFMSCLVRLIRFLPPGFAWVRIGYFVVYMA